MNRSSYRVVVLGGATLATICCLTLGWIVAQALPYGAVLAQGVFLAWAGTLLYAGFWRHRAAYRQRYATQAYQRLLHRFLLPAMVGGVAALWFPLLVDGERLLPPVIAYGLAAYLFAITHLMERRGKEIFWDIALRAFVYSVFPERGRMLTSGIFHWLRHPIYSAFIRYSLGLALLRNNVSALLCGTLATAGVWLLSRVEEREDLERPGSDYAHYRSRVPAFFVSRPVRFWRFLLSGNDSE